MISKYWLTALMVFAHLYGLGQVTFSLPLTRLDKTSSFGYRIHPVTGRRDFHAGTDLAASNQPVLAVLDGLVSETGYNPFLGCYVTLEHGRFTSGYGHLSFILVRKGDKVAAGEAIGISGSSGRVSGQHLHFSVRFKGKYINPLDFLHRIRQIDAFQMNISTPHSIEAKGAY